jgi:DNA-binding response OmpR family regulator
VARILIFEPNPDIRALVELVIRRLGHEPVVSDAGIPDPGDVHAAVIEPGDGAGIPLSRRLRERARPVIFTSIFPPDQNLLALEPVTYLVKPFTLYELETALTTAIAQITSHAAV